MTEYIEHGQVLEIEGPFPVDLGIYTQSSSLNKKPIDNKIYDFVIMKNPSDINKLLRYGGYCILISPLKNKVEDLPGFKTVYKQLTTSSQIIVSKKQHLCETSLPKTLIVYTFHKINDLVRYFLRYGIFESPIYSFLIVINDPILYINIPSYVKIINRKNIGFDFGGWSIGLNAINRENYNYYILINGSVGGTFVNKSNILWPDKFIGKLSEDIKLVRSLINFANINNNVPHVQSMVMAMNRETIEFLVNKNILNYKKMESSFINLTNEREIGTSRIIIENGGNIEALLPITNNVDFRNIKIIDSCFDNISEPDILQYICIPSDIIFVKTNHKFDLKWKEQKK